MSNAPLRHLRDPPVVDRRVTVQSNVVLTTFLLTVSVKLTVT